MMASRAFDTSAAFSPRKAATDRVYLLKKIHDRGYEGFSFDNMKFLDTVPRRRPPGGWRVRLVGRGWKPGRVTGRPRRSNDYPCVNSVFPAVSQRAADALRDLLEPNGQLLPFDTPVGRYFAYNATTVADAVDRRRSKINWLEKDKEVLDFDRYEFVVGKLNGLPIFRIPEDPNDLFVTEQFVQRAREHGLDGFEFIPIWPLRAGVHWRFVAKQMRDHRKASHGRRQPAKAPERLPAAKVTARAPRGAERESLREAVASCPAALSWDVERMTAEDVQRSILRGIEKLRKSRAKPEAKQDQAFWLGIAWGEALRRELGWSWMMLAEKGKRPSLGLVSPNRSRAVLPVAFVGRQVNDKGKDPTSLLLFNMVKDGKLPDAKRGELRLLG